MNAERVCYNCRKLTPMSELRSLCPDCKCWTPKELREAVEVWTDSTAEPFTTAGFLIWLEEER